MKKLMPLRSAVIVGAALAAGTTAGTTVAAVVPAVGQAAHGAGSVVAGAVALWFAERLDHIIDDEDDGCDGD